MRGAIQAPGIPDHLLGEPIANPHDAPAQEFIGRNVHYLNGSWFLTTSGGAG